MTVELVRGVPDSPLQAIVVRYAGFSQRESAPVSFRELPCTYIPVILDLGAGWRIASAAGAPAGGVKLGSFVAGLTDGPVVVEHAGRARCLQVDLTPFGARRLFGLPLSELTNLSVGLDDVLGRSFVELVERLDAAPDWPSRFTLVDRALAARLADARPLRGEVSWAFERLRGGGGQASIGALARELGWSHRRLIARFRDEVGLPPKLVARILRFERLVAVLRAEPKTEWARAAAACGYADQAHLSREVRRLSGLTPTALAADRVNFVQDADDVAG